MYVGIKSLVFNKYSPAKILFVILMFFFSLAKIHPRFYQVLLSLSNLHATMVQTANGSEWVDMPQIMHLSHGDVKGGKSDITRNLIGLLVLRSQSNFVQHPTLHV